MPFTCPLPEYVLSRLERSRRTKSEPWLNHASDDDNNTSDGESYMISSKPLPRNDLIDDEASCSSSEEDSDVECDSDSAETSSDEEVQHRERELARRKRMFRDAKRKFSRNHPAKKRKCEAKIQRPVKKRELVRVVLDSDSD